MRRHLRGVVVGFFCLGWFSACLATETATVAPTIQPVPRDNNKSSWWRKRHEAINARVKQGPVDLIFVGDSITQGWEGAGRQVWKEFYGLRNAANLGIGGDRTQHVLWRLEHGNLDGIAPKLAVVMIGTNNARHDPPEAVADGVAHIVQTLRAKLPETKILLLAIFPRGPNPSDASRRANEKANALIAKLADGKMVEYQDMGSRFLEPNGTLSRRVMPDLLHLSPAAYRRWAEAIEPAVAKALGPKPAPPREPEPTDEAGFVPLFDGKSLAGWRKAGGGATYTVEDGQIVGRRGPGANTFLCTEKDYGDFLLKLDVKFDVLGNSGIQLRSHQNRKGRVYGYQCELDPSERAWSGGIYDEARRAWIAPLGGAENAAARKALKLKDWNRITIRAVGPSIQTWINGVPCADLIDTEDLSGFIALQVHAGREGQVRWRNVRLKNLGQSQWKPLFDGRSLAGWRKIGSGKWTVRDGAIVGTKAASDKQFGHLISEKSYTDLAVRLKFKAVQGNSGLYFRVVEGGTAGVLGFQAEIDPKANTGGLYETRGRAWVVLPPQKLLKQCFKKPNAWNRMSVVAIGRRVVVRVNGVKTAVLVDDPGRTEGFIAIQLHANQDMHVEARDIEVLEIPRS